MKNGVLQVNIELDSYCIGSETQRLIRERASRKTYIDGIPIWVINNLKWYGNCFIQKAIYDLATIKKIVGFGCEYRRALDGKGWIIEKCMEVKN